MSSNSFDIVFYGMTVPGYQREKVKANLAALLKIGAKQVQALFSGKRVVLKKGVNAQVAEKYRSVLKEAGAVIKLEPHTVAVQRPTGSKPSAADESGLTLAAVGADVLAGSVVKDAAPLQLDLSALDLASLGADVADREKEPSPLQIDHGEVSVSAVGADVSDGEAEVTPPQVNLEGMDMSAVGADVSDAEKEPPALQVDLAAMSMSAAGADVADAEKDPEPPKVDLSAMSLGE